MGSETVGRSDGSGSRAVVRSGGGDTGKGDRGGMFEGCSFEFEITRGMLYPGLKPEVIIAFCGITVFADDIAIASFAPPFNVSGRF